MSSQDSFTQYVIENQFSNIYFWIFILVILGCIVRAFFARP